MVIGISRCLLAALFMLVTTGFQTTGIVNSFGTGKAVNPIAFPIRNLRLHMAPDEARPIIEQLNTENASRLDIRDGICVLDEISALKEHRDATRACVQSMKMDLSGKKFRVSLEFDEDLPKSPGIMRLWHVHFEQWDLKTEADVKSFLSAVVEKFGTPTFGTSSEIGYCAEIGPGKTCRVHYEEDYGFKVALYPLECVAVGVQRCPFQLGRVGLYARVVRGTYPPMKVEIDLYDAALDSQSAKEKTRMIDQSHTAGKPVL